MRIGRGGMLLRATAFDWKYMQSAADSSSDLLLYMSMACLVWLAPRMDLPLKAKRFSYLLLSACVFYHFIFQALNALLGVAGWYLVLSKAAFALKLSFLTLTTYSTLNYHASYYKRD